MAEHSRAKAEGNQPISRHPLFPAIVALWFGALFGLVSLAIKPELIEPVVAASGIDSIVPMAAPPLGAKMRILLALGMTCAGGVTGWLIALRIARPEPKAPEGRARRRSRPAKEGLALAGPVQENQAAREPAILNLSEFDLDGFADGAAPPAVALRQAGRAMESDAAFEAPVHDSPSPPAAAIATDGHQGALHEPDSPNDVPAPPVAVRHRAAERIVSAELDTLSQVELLERLALAMAQCRKAVVPVAAVARLEALDLPVLSPEQPEPEPAPQSESPFPAAPELFQADEAVHDVASAPAAWEEDAPASPPSPEPELQPLLLPAALRPVGHDSPDNDDSLPGYIPPRHITRTGENRQTGVAQPQPRVFDDDNDDDEAEDDVLDAGYSSLLDLSRSSLARPRFTGSEEGEAAGEVLPGAQNSAPADRKPFDEPVRSGPEETEKALRSALATLQRMSGAA